MIIATLVQLQSRDHLFDQIGNCDRFQFDSRMLLIKAGHTSKVRVFDQPFGLSIFAGRHIQPNFQSFQLGLRGQINPAILASEFQGPHFAVGQLRSHGFGAGLGLPQRVASLPNATSVEGVFDNPGLIPPPGDFLRAEADMHKHRIAFHVQRRTLGRSAAESREMNQTGQLWLEALNQVTGQGMPAEKTIPAYQGMEH